MRLTIEEDCIIIQAENCQDEAYLAHVLGLEKGGDVAVAMRCVGTPGPGPKPEPGFDYVKIRKDDDA